MPTRSSIQRTSNLFELAASVQAASAQIAFRSSFDPNSPLDWHDFAKYVSAMANSGGGVIVIGSNDDGSPSGQDISAISTLDPAEVARRIEQFMQQPVDLQLRVIDRSGIPAVAVCVGPADYPMGISDAAAQSDSNGAPTTVPGVFYFRHGVRTEPATPDDLRQLFERLLREVRRDWLHAVRQLVTAPPGATIQVVSKDPIITDALEAQPVRITDDPDAQPMRPQDIDRVYPYRQKDLLREISRRLPSRPPINAHDVQCVRRQHRLDEHPEFVFRLENAGRRYSHACLDWMAEQYRDDADFFHKAREAQRESMRLRRAKPR